MVLVHVHRFPNKQNHPRAICPKRSRRGGACVPARTSARRRFHTKNTRIVRGDERWMRPCRATRAGTQAPPLPISIIFFHTNKITICTQSTQTKPTIPRAICSNDTNRPTPNLAKRNRRGGAYVPARTFAQRRFHTQMNTTTHTSGGGNASRTSAPIL